MTATPTIEALTFILPAFGRQPMLERALASVSAQNVWPGEIIVVDDGSEPALELPALPRGLSARLIRHPDNLGAAAARNTGMRAARTEWVSFLDSDDWLVPGSLEQRWRLASDRLDPKSIYACGWHDVGPDGAPLLTRSPRPSVQMMDFASGCWFAPGSCIIMNAAEALRAAGGQDATLRRFEDFDWFLALGLQGFELRSQPVIGAAITRERSVPPSVVRDAAARIVSKWQARTSDRELLRRIRGYMALEMAASNHHAGNRFAAFTQLLGSFLRVPRTRLHFSPGWVTARDVDRGGHTVLRPPL